MFFKILILTFNSIVHFSIQSTLQGAGRSCWHRRIDYVTFISTEVFHSSLYDMTIGGRRSNVALNNAGKIYKKK